MSGYKRVNYYELCRLCTTTEGTKMHIFREEGRRRQIASKIPLCLPLQVAEDDSLPKIVCSSCVEKLESYYEFRESCINAEAMLESYFSTIRAEDHKQGQTATVYVRESASTLRDSNEPKIEVLPASAQVQAQAALVLPVGPDGLSNLIQAAGIQIITDGDSSRLQPLLGTTSTPIIEASDGSRYTYLNNATPTSEMTMEKHVAVKAEKPAEGTTEVEQNQQVQPQTITFAGQEMMVHFNVKDTDTTNPQLQRASIAQIGEFLKMNLVDGATLVKDPTVPGGFRILGLPQTVLTTQHMQEHQQQHQQHELQLHNQQIQHLIQDQSIHHSEVSHHQQQQEHLHQQLSQQQQQQLNQQQQQLSQQQQLNQQQHQLNQQQQQLNQQQQLSQQQLNQQQQQQLTQQHVTQQQLNQQQHQQLPQQPQQLAHQQQHVSHHPQQQLTQQQPINQSHQQHNHDEDQLTQQHLHQNMRHIQSSPKKRGSKKDSTKDQSGLPHQQSDQQPQQHQHQQLLHVSQQPHDMQHQEFSSGSILQITGDNDEPADDSRDDLSTHEDIDRHDSMCSSIEAVVSGAGGQEVNDSRNTDKFIYSCDDCPKLFKRKEHLYQHQKLHTGERPYVCPHCDKTFIRKEHLLRHSISHAGTKQFECDQCGKNFSRKDNLHKHRKTHSSEGPFVCHTCGKSFVVKHYFAMHLACHGVAVESENGEVVFDPLAFPFKCDVCGKGYPTKAFRDSHRLRHRKLNKKKNGDKDKGNPHEPVDQQSDDKDILDHNQHQLEDSNEDRKEDIHQLQIVAESHEGPRADLQDLGQLLDRSNVISLQSSASAPNGVNNMIPHIIQQIVPTSSSAVIQVQSSSDGTTFICSPEILETYQRMQSS